MNRKKIGQKAPKKFKQMSKMNLLSMVMNNECLLYEPTIIRFTF